MKNMRYGFLIFFFGLTACNVSENKNRETLHISFNEMALKDNSKSDKAEDYTYAAELLLTGENVEKAVEAVNIALKHDPSNFKAQFISHLASFLTLQKGLGKRFNNMAQAYPIILKNHLEDYPVWKSRATPGLIDLFTKGGGSDFVTEADLVTHFEKTVALAQKFINFLQQNKDKEITLKANSFLVPDLALRYADACEVKETAAGEFELTCPESRLRREVSFNRADYELMDMYTIMYRSGIALYTSYDLSGVLGSMEGLVKRPSYTEGEAYAEMTKNPKFGKLRAQSDFKNVRANLKRFLAQVRWAAANQSELCKFPNPFGGFEGLGRNRVGMFMNKGLCQAQSISDYLGTHEPQLNGAATPTVSERDGEIYQSEVNYLAVFDNPVSDIRELGLKHDKCGTVVGVSSENPSGVFPRNDANKLLKMAAKPCNL